MIGLVALVACVGDDPASMLPEPTAPWPPVEGCIAPPPVGFDPTLDYDWTPLPGDHLVTSAEDDGPGTLRDVLSRVEHGDVVTFDPALRGATVELDDELFVTKSITIDASAAPGFTLDARGRHRVMTLEKALNSTIVGLTFTNGDSPEEGGALRVRQADRGDPDNKNPRGSVTLIGCRFEDNEGPAAGAVLVGWRIDAVVRDCLFVGNDGTEGTQEQRGKSGGALATRQNASLRIERSAFVGNRGAKSGAVYNILEPVVVEDSVFVGNVATSGSGAFFTDGGNGAGPSNDPDNGAEGQIVLRRVRIVDNEGTGDGGAMLLWGYPRDVIVIEHSVIANNLTSGDKGGGGRVHGLDDVIVSGTTVADNASGQQGGGLWIDGRGDVHIVNATFSGNSVERDAGGGFAYHGSGDLLVESSLFAHNQAGRAAGAFWVRPAVEGTARNNVFAFNVVGENQGERHIGGGRPEDLGGHVDFSLEGSDRGRAYADGEFADPLLTPLDSVDGTLLHTFGGDSPLVDAAVGGGPAVDARGAPRGDTPDIGPYEFGSACPAG